MKKFSMIGIVVLAVFLVVPAISVFAHDDLDSIYELIHQAREDVRAIRAEITGKVLESGEGLGDTHEGESGEHGRAQVETHDSERGEHGRERSEKALDPTGHHLPHKDPEGHPKEGEDEGRESGELEGNKPTDPKLKMIYNEAKLLRSELRALRGDIRTVLLSHKEATKAHAEASSGEHSGEGRGEHSGEGEESGQAFTLNETYNKARRGVRLILAYDKASSSFIGTVENVTNRTIRSVRVEVHLSNGTELGPTRPIDLSPGKKASVKLSAPGQSFSWWKAHPEAGSGEHSGEGQVGSKIGVK